MNDPRCIGLHVAYALMLRQNTHKPRTDFFSFLLETDQVQPKIELEQRRNMEMSIFMRFFSVHSSSSSSSFSALLTFYPRLNGFFVAASALFLLLSIEKIERNPTQEMSFKMEMQHH